MLQKYLKLPRPVSVEVSMNTPHPRKYFFKQAETVCGWLATQPILTDSKLI
jgi:hypothetical protein